MGISRSHTRQTDILPMQSGWLSFLCSLRYLLFKFAGRSAVGFRFPAR
jgi:hypothetical protein